MIWQMFMLPILILIIFIVGLVWLALTLAKIIVNIILRIIKSEEKEADNIRI